MQEYLRSRCENIILFHNIDTENKAFSEARSHEEREIINTIDRMGDKLLNEHNFNVLDSRERSTRQRVRSIGGLKANETIGTNFRINIANIDDSAIIAKIPLIDEHVDLAALNRDNNLFNSLNCKASTGLDRIVRGTLHSIFDPRPEIAVQLTGRDAAKKFTELPPAFKI
ncbi:hypothetical protein PMAYCL1PPCAC_31430, partial [Pristionchus mayeri]